MSHSPHTAYKYYQFPETVSKAAVMHDHIVKLTKKQQFTQEEDDFLMTEWSLTVEKAPSLAFCREIILKYDVDKSDKQLHDRWRYFEEKYSALMYIATLVTEFNILYTKCTLYVHTCQVMLWLI